MVSILLEILFSFHEYVSGILGWVRFVQESLAHNDSSNASVCFLLGKEYSIFIFHFMWVGEGWGRSSQPSLLTQHLEIGALGGFSRKYQLICHFIVVFLFDTQYSGAVKLKISFNL